MSAVNDSTIRIYNDARGREEAAGVALFSVDDLQARVKRIVTTDEGRLQIVLESEALSDEAILQVKNLLQLQQDTVVVSVRAAQGDLFQ
jgi:hypothetical protein